MAGYKPFGFFEPGILALPMGIISPSDHSGLDRCEGHKDDEDVGTVGALRRN